MWPLGLLLSALIWCSKLVAVYFLCRALDIHISLLYAGAVAAIHYYFYRAFQVDAVIDIREIVRNNIVVINRTVAGGKVSG